jgi:hypothetical protein
MIRIDSADADRESKKVPFPPFRILIMAMGRKLSPPMRTMSLNFLFLSER